MKLWVCFLIYILGLLKGALPATALDGEFEGRFKAGTQYVIDSPDLHKDFDSEAELRFGVLGNAWEKEEWQLDYELSADAKQVDGPSEQASLRQETDVDLFRAWLRLDNGRLTIRGGRQKIMFGSGFIFRPLGFFDTRNVTGVVPVTRGVDGLRSTFYLNDTSSIQGWIVPAKINDRMIAGLRWEALISEVESGLVAQYHPVSDLDDLPQFGQELIQLGYHFKGEYHAGLWSEGRVDFERVKENYPFRFDAVVGTDYTFDIGDGLHVLLEYFLSTREPQYTQDDAKGDRTIHQFGLLLDQPVGADVAWQLFSLFDVRDGSFQLVPQVEYTLTSQVFLYISGKWGGTLKTNRTAGRLFKETVDFNGTEPNVGLTVVAYF
ncbi:MAG TPA: hypothetical protein DCX78_04580 [Nitrospina sp.]|jgi:hypothetical protein|nr:hypothetical protein [Nitrospinota bacterium]MBV51580.1 hypothetical protein [Nitrospinota bacterium]MDP6335985.1 hypothetical protein [Nitrospinaceae bacterium]MDP7148037.1 hypothetical protein [Nitrospinaceae bacterium]HAX46090.1 hypothetical protein [Nitrospina sp.]|tara:strand:+ start:87 stop:1220 length:1134 start_codon:yes stop_codon:yes gene_type:complete